MIILVSFVLVLLLVGVVLVIRSGMREVVMDEKDNALAEAKQIGEDQIVPTSAESQQQDSWTLESTQDTAQDHEGE